MVNTVRATTSSTHQKSVKIGILDLIANKPTHSLYAKMINPNFASIMPQVVGVWAEQLGHKVHFVTYTGSEELQRELPSDIDILFVCAFTPAAYLAYSISNLFRKQNVVTVLGGPHARAYAADATNYFDYVLGFTDKTLIHELLKDFSPHPREGVMLSAQRQPLTLPGVRERWKFIRQTLDKARFAHVVPMIGSLGCPYTCSFCIDSQVDYQTLPYDEIRDDLRFLQKELKHPVVGWHDPNFGVRFDDYMGLIEEAVKPGGVQFIAESTLSLLSEAHLKRLQRNHFVMMITGIESWFDFSNKAGQRKKSGFDKVEAVAEHLNLVAHHIPYTQANFVWGLDFDIGPLPFELTKRFLELAPSVYPAYSLYTAFGDSAPLNIQLQQEGRVLPVPFQFLDGYSTFNVKLKNYTPIELFDYLIDLVRHSHSPGAAWRRFKSNKHSLFAAPRWMQLVRSMSKDGRGRYAYYTKIRHMLATDHEFQAFCSGKSTSLPSFFRNTIKAELGAFYDDLPDGVLGRF